MFPARNSRRAKCFISARSQGSVACRFVVPLCDPFATLLHTSSLPFRIPKPLNHHAFPYPPSQEKSASVSEISDPYSRTE
jgi:hypothetical protein